MISDGRLQEVSCGEIWAIRILRRDVRAFQQLDERNNFFIAFHLPSDNGTLHHGSMGADDSLDLGRINVSGREQMQQDQRSHSITRVEKVRADPVRRRSDRRSPRNSYVFDFAGAPDTIRTCDLCLRRATLYPAELRVPQRFT